VSRVNGHSFMQKLSTILDVSAFTSREIINSQCLSSQRNLRKEGALYSLSGAVVL
jgi:hypothetical protein